MHSDTESFLQELTEIGRRTSYVKPDKVMSMIEPQPDPPTITETLAVSDPVESVESNPVQTEIDQPVGDSRGEEQSQEERTQTDVRDTDSVREEVDDTDIDETNAIVNRVTPQNDRLVNLPERERPRERMHQLGPAGITTTELLAIVLGSGIQGKNVKNVADELLVTFDSLRGLSRVSAFNMRKVDGIGSTKADVLTAAFELGRRAALEDVESTEGDYGSHMPNGESIAWSVAKQFTTHLRDSPQEEMWIVFLDVRNRYRGKTRVYIGCCDQLVAKTGEILSRVVERNFPRYALVHNHPSGRGDPSGADISFTDRLVMAGHLLDIELVDHIVLGEDMRSFVSMRQRKLVDFLTNSRPSRKLS